MWLVGYLFTNYVTTAGSKVSLQELIHVLQQYSNNFIHDDDTIKQINWWMWTAAALYTVIVMCDNSSLTITTTLQIDDPTKVRLPRFM